MIIYSLKNLTIVSGILLSQQAWSQDTKQGYAVTIELGSLGAGIDRQLDQKLNEVFSLQEHPSIKSNFESIEVITESWGLEGERTYCFELTSSAEQTAWYKRLEGFVLDSIERNYPSRIDLTTSCSMLNSLPYQEEFSFDLSQPTDLAHKTCFVVFPDGSTAHGNGKYGLCYL